MASDEMIEEALERMCEFERNGEGVPLEEMRAYLEARAAGEHPSLPRPRKIELDDTQ